MNKYELRKLHQAHNAYYLNMSNNNNNSRSQSSSSNTIINTNRSNRCGGVGGTSSMIYRAHHLVNATQHHQHHHPQYQLSSGYNSENHSNSSISYPTSNTQNNTQTSSNFNFYRLSLNHLPINFANNLTFCTCGAYNNSNNIKPASCNNKSTLSNNNLSFKTENTDDGGKNQPLLSSSPKSQSQHENNNNNKNYIEDEEEEEDDELDDEDDEDLDEDEEDIEIREEEEQEILPNNTNKKESVRLSKESLSKTSNSSLNRLQNATHSNNMPGGHLHRAPGTSNCPHTAKIDIRRVRSFSDLRAKQLIFSKDDFIIKEKLGEGFFANVKKIISKKVPGQEMVLKELKLNCINFKQETDSNASDCLYDEQNNYNNNCNNNNQPRMDLIINYAELNAAHKSFLKEAQVLRNLNHPNVIKFMGVMFEKEKQFNLVLEYIGGGTLKDIIHNISMPLPWKLRVGYARDIAAAMQYLHSLRIIHRDLKSDNCLVRENGRTVVVADFGLSRINNSGSATLAANSKGQYLSARNNNNNNSSIMFQDMNNLSSSSILKFPNLIPHSPSNNGGSSSSATNSIIVAAKRKLKRRALKQRYAVVGNSFSMAPEMLNHQIYDERVDIFSFGIICCEIIGRVQADPDYLPRTSDFGLNVELFRKKYCEADCPKHFIKIAIACCELQPEKRPPFAKTHLWLETILSHLAANNPIPKNLLKNILDQNSGATPTTK
jgi:serine/threonine protein kinase